MDAADDVGFLTVPWKHVYAHNTQHKTFSVFFQIYDQINADDGRSAAALAETSGRDYTVSDVENDGQRMCQLEQGWMRATMR